MKRYIKEFANDVKRKLGDNNNVTEEIDKVLGYKNKSIITDIEAIENLIKIYKENEYNMEEDDAK